MLLCSLISHWLFQCNRVFKLFPVKKERITWKLLVSSTVTSFGIMKDEDVLWKSFLNITQLYINYISTKQILIIKMFNSEQTKHCKNSRFYCWRCKFRIQVFIIPWNIYKTAYKAYTRIYKHGKVRMPTPNILAGPINTSLA